jgi:Transglycosylase SLT domain
MTALTVTAALALIAQYQCVSPSVAPVIVGVAQHESGLQETAIHDNASGKSYFPDTKEQAATIARSLIAIGHSSLDLGISQVNMANFGWTGLTIERAFDACRSFAAGAAVLFAKYNGSPPDAVKAAYASDVTRRIAALDGAAPTQEASVDHADPQPPAWNLEAVAEWRRRHAPTAEDASNEAAPGPAIVEPIRK